MCAVLSLRFVSHDGYFAPLSLHADVVITASSELRAVEGTGRTYKAGLTNYGAASVASSA